VGCQMLKSCARCGPVQAKVVNCRLCGLGSVWQSVEFSRNSCNRTSARRHITKALIEDPGLSAGYSCRGRRGEVKPLRVTTRSMDRAQWSGQTPSAFGPVRMAVALFKQ
jgi:hypothetical protein